MKYYDKKCCIESIIGNSFRGIKSSRERLIFKGLMQGEDFGEI